MISADQLTGMSADELRLFAVQLLSEISDVRRDNTFKQTKIDQLTHEMALLKR
jgi:transposase